MHEVYCHTEVFITEGTENLILETQKTAGIKNEPP